MASTKSSKQLTPAAKAAAVIISLGADEAAEVYKYLGEDEIETLSYEVAKLDRIPDENMQSIMEDFYGLCVTRKVVADGGVVYAKSILEKAFGPEKAEDYMNRVSQSLQTRAFEFIRKANYKSLLMMLQNEHPQTIAFVLSYARAEQASQVLAELPKKLQIDVLWRMANLESVNPTVVSMVEDVMEKRFSSVVTVDMTEIGGINYVADVMNHTDRTTEKNIFDGLNERDPQLSSDIRKRMFVFEDIIQLDNISIQRFLRDVNTQDLAVALKGANDEVKEAILNNMSKRSQESILSDIEYLHNVRMRDVEEAQQQIVEVIRKLEEGGEIVISRGGDDEIIA
ncbi:flagellar motor switch protein FliG [Caproicibacterium argilliputei]|uniref:flagellar motor switch protein FliG n=1 Tax=Caproicibacterium sp. XB1 TaxID=3396405 RepID=UPI0023DCA828